jgi:hypothetical protein
MMHFRTDRPGICWHHFDDASKAGAPEPEIWFVDLHRNDRTPYDPEEIAILKWHIDSITKQPP